VDPEGRRLLQRMQQEAEGRRVSGTEVSTRPAFAPAAFSFLVLDQLAGRFRHQLRAPPLTLFEEQQALAEDEAVEQERLRIGFLARKACGAIELADILQPCGVNAGD